MVVGGGRSKVVTLKGGGKQVWRFRDFDFDRFVDGFVACLLQKHSEPFDYPDHFMGGLSLADWYPFLSQQVPHTHTGGPPRARFRLQFTLGHKHSDSFIEGSAPKREIESTQKSTINDWVNTKWRGIYHRSHPKSRHHLGGVNSTFFACKCRFVSQTTQESTLTNRRHTTRNSRCFGLGCARMIMGTHAYAPYNKQCCSGQ